MKILSLFIFIFAIAVGIKYFYQTKSSSENRIETIATEEPRCDGRQYCSQMTSCHEALFFLKNCPNTSLDGDGDQVPCEEQWCGHVVSDQRNFR